MARIAVLIGDLFEDVEYAEPTKAFGKAGHEIVHVGLQKNTTVKGKKEGIPVKIGLAVKDADVGNFDALFIPGGYSPDKLRVDEDAVGFTREFMKSAKPVFSICHGPQLLITADVLRDRKVTGWKSIIQDIKNAGAEFIDQEVVEDGNLVSSRQPSDIPAFVEACLKKLSQMSERL